MADGYHAYRGVGGLSTVDVDNEVGSAAAGASSITLTSIGHTVSTKYTYVLRPHRDSLITPDFGCNVIFETDANGDWLGNRPYPVTWLSAEVIDAGKITLRWSYKTPPGYTAPEDFCIYYANEPGITVGSPNTTESYASDGNYSKDLTLTDGTTYYFAITARSSDSVESDKLELAESYVADSTGPDSPTVYISHTW